MGAVGDFLHHPWSVARSRTEMLIRRLPHSAGTSANPEGHSTDMSPFSSYPWKRLKPVVVTADRGGFSVRGQFRNRRFFQTINERQFAIGTRQPERPRRRFHRTSLSIFTFPLQFSLALSTRLDSSLPLSWKEANSSVPASSSAAASPPSPTLTHPTSRCT